MHCSCISQQGGRMRSWDLLFPSSSGCARNMCSQTIRAADARRPAHTNHEIHLAGGASCSWGNEGPPPGASSWLRHVALLLDC